MKKVCILQNGLARGGTDTFVVNLCRGLDKSKFDITVINPSNREGSIVREPDVIGSGAKIIHTTPLTNVRNKLKHLIQLYFFLKKNKIDVFHTNIDLFNGPNLFVAWLARVSIRCCHSHNTRQSKELIEGKKLSVRIYQNVMRYLCRYFSNRKCGCSNDAMNFLFPNLRWEAYPYPTIINNGIDLESYACSIDVDIKKSDLGLNNKYNILTIGHLISQKNPLFTTRMFVDLCKQRDDIDLVWIGDGELKQDVISILEKEDIIDRVHFLGYRNDVNQIMKCCDLFILPSNFEGLGIVAIEAQASNLNCLLSDKIPVETDCGASIYLPIDRGTKIWIDNISKIINGEIRLFVDEKKLKEFSIEHMCEQMTKVFES